MASVRQRPSLPGTRIEPKDERVERIAAACAMWAGGVLVASTGTIIGATPAGSVHRVVLLTAGAAAFALLLAIVLPRLAEPWLHRATVALTLIGCVVLAVLCAWTGDLGSGYVYFYFFPAIFAGCFFGPRGRTLVLVWNAACLGVLAAGAPPTVSEAASAVAIIVASTTASVALGAERRRLRAAEMEERRLALADPLTGLHNVRSLRDEAAHHPLRPGTAVILIDIDSFKAVNTRHGHPGADRLLVEIAQGLLRAGDERDTIARVGGDEFFILTRDRDDAELDALARACDAAVRVARNAARLDGPEVTATLGVARWPQDGETLLDLAAAADAALLAAKARRPAALPPPPTPVGAPPLRTPPPTAVADDEPAGAEESPRPVRALVRGATWLMGGVIAFAGLVAVDPPPVLLALCVVAFVAGMGVGVFLVVARPADDHPIHRVTAVIAVPILLLGVAVTGGPTSPIMPLLLGPIAVHAHQFGPRQTFWRLVKSTLVFASPFLYDPDATAPEHVMSFIVLVATAVTLSIVAANSRLAIERAEQAARELARRDPLTGLYNRRAFVEEVGRRVTEQGGAQWVAVVDLDDFKRVNDVHGHAAGDIVLERIAAALAATVRDEDFVARVGGDEFAIILPRYDRETSAALGTRLIAAVERAAADAGYADCGVSATIGVASQDDAVVAGLDPVEAADAALMRAKEAGKGQVSVHPPAELASSA